MVGCQKKTLPLVGLVASLPTALGFAPTRHGGRGSSSSSIDVSPSADAEASRRAFLVASTTTLVGTLFARPAKADVGRFTVVKDLFKKPNGQVDSSDSESDDDDSDSDSVSSEDEEQTETAKEEMKGTDATAPASIDLPGK
jgi:hypothetical protein